MSQGTDYVGHEINTLGGILPSGGITGGLSSAKNFLEGDPAGAQQQLTQLMNMAFQQGNNINSTLQREKGQSEQYFRPMQQMFGGMYGTGGVKPGVAPGMPGSSPISGMFPQKGTA